MKIYFTTDKKWYSRLVRWLFKQPASHMGLGFMIRGNCFIIDITKPCGSVYIRSYWLAKHDVVARHTIDLRAKDELKFFNEVRDYAVLRPYAWKAYYYGLWRGLLLRLFNKPLPTTNKYREFNRGLCTNILEKLRPMLKEYGVDLSGVDLYAQTPSMLEKRFAERLGPDLEQDAIKMIHW